MRLLPWVFLFVVSFTIACGPGGEAASGTWVATDSAGIMLVESLPKDRPRIFMAEQRVAISPDESRPETLFGNVVDVAADDEGRIYVLDQMAREVRVFGGDGRYAGPMGRAGQGPGEFSAFAQSLLVYGDTVLVSDAGNRSVQRFLRSGEFVDSRPQPGSQSARTWWEFGSDGLYARALAMSLGDDGSWQSEDRVLRVAGDAGVDTVADFAYPVTDIGRRGDPKVPYIVNSPMWTPLASGGVAWTHLESDRIMVLDPQGSLTRIVHFTEWQLREPGMSDVEAMESLMREKLAMLGGDPSGVDNLPVVPPTHLPAITALKGGPDGTIWVQRMGGVEDVYPMALNAPEPPAGWGGATWDVITVEGEHLYQVDLPTRFRLMEIRGNVLYGVLRNELDEETVVVLERVT